MRRLYLEGFMGRYRQKNGKYCIDVNFHDFKQLYDGRDPSPFYERDLDEDLIRYLVMSCEEIGTDRSIKIVLTESGQSEKAKQREDFKQALHHFFEHEVRATENELKHLYRQGRTSLFFALVFLVVCVFLAVKIIGNASVITQAISEGLIITGWVALWKPINIFLYEGWPYNRKKRVYQILSHIEVEFQKQDSR